MIHICRNAEYFIDTKQSTHLIRMGALLIDLFEQIVHITRKSKGREHKL
jgi:hypothetical protein